MLSTSVLAAARAPALHPAFGRRPSRKFKVGSRGCKRRWQCPQCRRVVATSCWPDVKRGAARGSWAPDGLPKVPLSAPPAPSATQSAGGEAPLLEPTLPPPTTPPHCCSSWWRRSLRRPRPVPPPRLAHSWSSMFKAGCCHGRRQTAAPATSWSSSSASAQAPTCRLPARPHRAPPRTAPAPGRCAACVGSGNRGCGKGSRTRLARALLPQGQP